jgi:hypothetical protein
MPAQVEPGEVLVGGFDDVRDGHHHPDAGCSELFVHARD